MGAPLTPEQITADALAWFERQSKAALARVLGTPERADPASEPLAGALRREREAGQ